MVAISWTMTGLTDSVALVALVQTAANLPIMLFAIVSGTLADMLSRRSVMLFAQSTVLTFSILLTLLAALGQLTPALLLLLTFMIGCGTALNGPAWQASVGEIVSRADISSAVSFNIVGNNLARSTGPALGGAVVAGLGASWAFLLSAFSYLVILGAVWRWRPSPTIRLPTGFRRSVRHGVGHALAPGRQRALLGRALTFSLGASVVWAMMPAVVIDRGGDAFLFGLLFASFGLGGVAGVLAGVYVRAQLGHEWVARLGTGAMAIAVGLLGLSETIPLALIAHGLAGAGWVCALSTFNISIQLAVSREMVGRQLAIYQTTTFGSLALGSAIWGLIASRLGLSTTFVSASLFLVVAVLVGIRSGLPRPISNPDH